MTMEKKSYWREHNVTIAAYIPVEVYERLVRMADEKTKAEGKWYSLSRLIREIITEAAGTGN